MSSDPMDQLLELENTFYKEGYDLGIQDGSRTGRIEGRLFGLTSAFEKFSTMGNLHGRSVIWSARLSTPQLANTKLEVSANEPDAMATNALPTKSTQSSQDPGPAGISPSSPLPQIPHNSRLEKHIQTLYALTEPASLSTDNTEDAVSDFNDRLKRAEGKAKIIERLLDEDSSNEATRQAEENLEMDFTRSHPKPSRSNGGTGFVGPLAQIYDPSLPNVVSLNKYASVMPYHFFRNISNGTSTPTFGSTSVPNDTSFAPVDEADFLVFDQERAAEILGPNPSYEFVFEVSEAVHEAPVYVASQNELYLSQLAPPPGYLPQLVVDLNQDPPTLSEYLSDPLVYAPNGGTFHNGLIYWGASGGNNSIGGMEQRVGLRTLDPLTNKSTTILNNYFGYYFNTVDDLFVHLNGDIWFTDP
ncbi:MAG: hypothetical protein Q9226_008957, partial [Calogaya cf. arnoldii]